MSKFDVPEYYKQRPVIQLAPLVDIAFWALIFYLVISIYSQNESELSIKVPPSTVVKESLSNPGKIVIHISKEGQFVVNDQRLDQAGLEQTLQKVGQLFSNQQVVIRADRHTYHKYVVQALDACAKAKIIDISFSTTRDENKD